MHMRTDLDRLFEWNELRMIGIELAIGNHVAQAFEIVGRIVDSALWQADPFLLPVHPKQCARLALEEIRQIFAEDHGNAGQVAQSWHHPAGFQLGEETCGKSGMSA